MYLVCSILGACRVSWTRCIWCFTSCSTVYDWDIYVHIKCCLSLSLYLLSIYDIFDTTIYIYFFPRFSKLSTYIGFNWYISLLYMSCIYKPGSEKDMCSRPLCSMGRDVFRDMSCPVRARCIVFGRWDYSRGVPWIVGVSHESYVDCAMLQCRCEPD